MDAVLAANRLQRLNLGRIGSGVRARTCAS
jgi:hypothetical protein